MKTITIEVEDGDCLAVINLLKKLPIKIIAEQSDNISRIKTPLEEVGFISCGVADENLSVNYKDKLTDYLKEKHDI